MSAPATTASKHRDDNHAPGFDRFAEFNAGRRSGQLLPGSSPFTGVVVLDPHWTPAHRGVSVGAASMERMGISRPAVFDVLDASPSDTLVAIPERA